MKFSNYFNVQIVYFVWELCRRYLVYGDIHYSVNVEIKNLFHVGALRVFCIYLDPLKTMF